jgi:hypothetical protein
VNEELAELSRKTGLLVGTLNSKVTNTRNEAVIRSTMDVFRIFFIQKRHAQNAGAIFPFASENLRQGNSRVLKVSLGTVVRKGKLANVSYFCRFVGLFHT